MKISIIISTFGRSSEIKKLFSSVENNFPEDSYEIIIVSSDDPESEKVLWLKTQKNTVVINPDFRTGKRTKSLYYYENIGIQASKYDWLLVISDDMYVDDNFYPEFLKHLDCDVVFLNTHIGQTDLGLRIPIIGTYKTPDSSTNILYLSDFVICKKSVFDVIGPLDENIDWYGKGVDFTLNICFSKTPFKINYDSNLYLNHAIALNDRDDNSISAATYNVYIEQKWRLFCEKNEGYDFIVNW